MRFLLMLLIMAPLSANASFLFQYGLNYSSQKDSSNSGEFTESRTFHKVLLGASVNSAKTLFFGWNINSWTSELGQGTATKDDYSLTEMGPKLQWFLNENYNAYLSLEWNPYAKGKRTKSGTSKDISGSSTGFGIGYRFRLSKLMGLGASIQYHSLGITEEITGSSKSSVSDKVTNLMPMLEFSIMFR